MRRRSGFAPALVGLSLGLASSLVAVPAAAQKVGTGAAGRAVNIIRDSAYPRTVAMIYEGLFSFVRIERSEPGAAPSRHPVSVSASVLQKALAGIQFRNEPLFSDDELAEIVSPLVTALARATPDQDVSFAVSGRHSALGPLVPRSVTTGRVFRSAEGLQLIIGLAHQAFEAEFNGSGVLVAFEPGRRATPVSPSLHLSGSEPGLTWRRGDWASFDLDGMAAAAEPPPVTATPALRAAPAPVAAPAPPADADARYRQISERLKTLQRLRDAGLITQQEYDERRRAILDSL